MATKTNNKKANKFEINNIDDIIKLEQQHRIKMNLSDRIASAITEFSGSMLYVFLHVIWFGAWIILNTNILSIKPFDPFPFSLLTMIVSLEAIFLSSFVLISQNKQSLQADKRAKIDLQINTISEKENTKLIEMVAEIHKKLGIHVKKDKEITAMEKTTSIKKLADAIDKADKKVEKNDKKGSQDSNEKSK